MSKKALIVYRGPEVHEPEKISQLFKKILEKEGFEVEISTSLDSFNDREKLMNLNLIIPHYTGSITPSQIESVLQAVAGGVGMAGCHGGMCDAFRDNIDWQFMTGGQWVAHPGGAEIKYKVEIKKGSSPIVDGIDDFMVTSEQYYMHVDPAVKVLATTRFPLEQIGKAKEGKIGLDSRYGMGAWNFEQESAYNGPHINNGKVDMPVLWCKYFGKGRIFYSSVGHSTKELKEEPVLSIIQRGLLWAAK